MNSGTCACSAVSPGAPAWNKSQFLPDGLKGQVQHFGKYAFRWEDQYDSYPSVRSDDRGRSHLA